MTSTTIVLGPAGTALLVDPGVDPSELAGLADELHRRGLTVVAGVATHPHWDHLLWHRDWAAVPRYAAAKAVRLVAAAPDELVRQAEADRPGCGPHVWPGLTAVPAGPSAGRLPWDGPPVRVLHHDAHAPGHLALVVEPDGVLLAGDMLSDVEIPLLDLEAVDPVGDYRAALSMFADLPDIHAVVPGHGSVDDGDGFRRRIAADEAYLDGLTSRSAPDDRRLAAMAPGWLHTADLAHRTAARGEMR